MVRSCEGSSGRVGRAKKGRVVCCLEGGAWVWVGGVVGLRQGGVGAGRCRAKELRVRGGVGM